MRVEGKVLVLFWRFSPLGGGRWVTSVITSFFLQNEPDKHRCLLAMCTDPEAVCGHVSTAREFRCDETTSLSPMSPALSSSILRTWLCMWSSTKENPIKSRLQLWWGLECSRSALDLFNYKVLPLLSTHSGSHGCDFDRVFTKFYKWVDNMLLESSWRLTSNQRGPTWTALKNCLCVGVNPSPSVEDFKRPPFFKKHYFISLNPSRLIFPFVAWLRGVWQGAKRVKQVQPGRVPSSQLWK